MCATCVRTRFLTSTSQSSARLHLADFSHSYYADWLQRPEIQDALAHFTNYTAYSTAVSYAFYSIGDDPRTGDTIPQLKRLLAAGVGVALYSGSADYNVNWLGTLAIAEGMGVAGFDQAGFQTFESAAAGNNTAVVKQAGQFSFTRVFDAGHEVPFYQPITSLELFERVIFRKDIATGKLDADAAYLSVGPHDSTQQEDVGGVQYDVTPDTATYNTTTHRPNDGGAKVEQRALGRLLRHRDVAEPVPGSTRSSQRKQREPRLQRPFSMH
jgi:carboxypeptidase D